MREAGINRAEAAEDSFVTGEMFEVGARAGEIAVGEQEEQNGERGENNLERAIEPQGADEHDGGEQSPHGQIRRHRCFVGGRAPSQFGQDDQSHQRPPEETVGKKSGGGESVSLFPFHDAGNDLGGTAITEAHGQDHGVEFVETGVVQVEQHRGHAETEQPERSGISGVVFDVSDGIVHKKSVEG